MKPPAELLPNLEPALSQIETVHGMMRMELLGLVIIKDEHTADQLGADFGDPRVNVLVQQRQTPYRFPPSKEKQAQGKSDLTTFPRFEDGSQARVSGFVTKRKWNASECQHCGWQQPHC